MHSHPAYHARGRDGFTIIELMIVIVVIGVLVAIAVPAFDKYRKNAKVARTAAEMKSLSTAFQAYKAAFGDFPPDSHANLPAGMETFINPQIWADETPIGGNYNWEGPDTYTYAGLSVFQPTSPQWMIDLLDNMLDDGNNATGRFRVMNGRPTLILEEE